MKRIIVLLTLFILHQSSFAQSPAKSNNKKELMDLLNTFMECISTRDSVKLYSLFHQDPVVWIGVYKETTQQKRTENDSTIQTNYKTSDYKTWFRNISKGAPRQEKFSNINIVEDGSIASVTFDYSFWTNNKKGNWGKESWALIKADGKWKIVSVLFSIELEKYLPEPS